MTRRPNQTGCVGRARRKDGRLAGYVTLPDGGRRWAYARTPAELARKVRSLGADLAGGRLSGTSQRFGVYVEAWLRTKALAGKRPATLARYQAIVRTHLVPRFGRLRLDRIGAPAIQAWVDDLREGGLAPSTVRLAHAVLSMILRAVVARRELAHNPCLATELPRGGARPRRALAVETVLAILEEAAADRLFGVYAVLVATGLRSGEVFDLAWADLDLERATLRVRDPKTPAGRRAVELPAWCVAVLRHQQALQARERADAVSWRESGLVFTSVAGTRLRLGNFHARSWRPLLGRLATRGLAWEPPLVLHELRHTHNSWLIARGVDLVRIQARLGHARPELLLRVYGHLVPGEPDPSAAILDRLLGDQLGRVVAERQVDRVGGPERHVQPHAAGVAQPETNRLDAAPPAVLDGVVAHQGGQPASPEILGASEFVAPSPTGPVQPDPHAAAQQLGR